jgi:hypothetical protein
MERPQGFLPSGKSIPCFYHEDIQTRGQVRVSEGSGKLVQKNTRHCRIWDQQEALEDGYFGMHKPAVSLGEDPDEVIRYIGGLFQEKE